MDKKDLSILHKPWEFSLKNNPYIRIKVRGYGYIYAELFPSEAPATVEHFLSLVDQGFYNGMIIHRVLKNRLVQTGDPTGTGFGGCKKNVHGEFLVNGYVNRISHTTGVLAFARTEDYNSGSSQFFINLTENTSFNGLYAAFGYISDPKAIQFLKKVSKSKHILNDKYKPATDFYIDEIVKISADAILEDKKLSREKAKKDKQKIKEHDYIDQKLELEEIKKQRKEKKESKKVKK